MAQPSQVERIAAMEVRLKNLEDKVDGMDKKLDDLLALRNKGAGIVWFLGPIGLLVFEFIRYYVGGK